MTCRVKANRLELKNIIPSIILANRLKPVLFRIIKSKLNTRDWKHNLHNQILAAKMT